VKNVVEGSSSFGNQEPRNRRIRNRSYGGVRAKVKPTPLWIPQV
jgi:hypothetical protein